MSDFVVAAILTKIWLLGASVAETLDALAEHGMRKRVAYKALAIVTAR